MQITIENRPGKNYSMLFFSAQRSCFESLNVLDFHEFLRAIGWLFLRQTNVKLIDMPGLLVPGSMAERLTLEDLKAELQFFKKKTHVKGVEKMIWNLLCPKTIA